MIKSEFLITTGMDWPVSSDKWKAPFARKKKQKRARKEKEQGRGESETKKSRLLCPS